MAKKICKEKECEACGASKLDLMQHLKMEKMSWMSILKCWKPELI